MFSGRRCATLRVPVPWTGSPAVFFAWANKSATQRAPCPRIRLVLRTGGPCHFSCRQCEGVFGSETKPFCKWTSIGAVSKLVCRPDLTLSTLVDAVRPERRCTQYVYTPHPGASPLCLSALVVIHQLVPAKAGLCRSVPICRQKNLTQATSSPLAQTLDNGTCQVCASLVNVRVGAEAGLYRIVY